VAVVDWDVHHGNGTQACFWERGDVVTVSLHMDHGSWGPHHPQTGAPAFVIEPGGWVLALEDRGHEFLVQHTDGRVGVLRDLSNIERG